MKAQASVEGQLEGIADTKNAGVDGLWGKLRGGGKRVVLMLTDSVTGLVFPPLIAKGEESAESFRQLFARAEQAGLDLLDLLRTLEKSKTAVRTPIYRGVLLVRTCVNGCK